MAQHNEHLWQAYIDGQLSAAEASQFEESLTPDERDLLAADVAFERRLADKLSQPTGIPDDVWNRTLAKLDAARAAKAPQARGFSRWTWGGITLAAAAMIAFLISGSLSDRDLFGPPSIVMAAESIDALAADAKTEATLEAVEAFLQDLEVPLAVSLELDKLYAVHGQGHRMRFLGAGSTPFDGHDVPELYFDCCSFPAKVVIAKRDSAAADAIKLAFGNSGDVQAVRDTGDYLIAVVGIHPAHDLLDTIVTPH